MPDTCPSAGLDERAAVALPATAAAAERLLWYETSRSLRLVAVFSLPLSLLTCVTSFADAPTRAISASDFAPTRRPHPRPWHRIAVPGAGSKIGLRTVWKRIGGVPRSDEDTRYIKSYLELRSDGQGPRKHRRTERHVPVWDDAHWRHSLSDAESIGEELAKARGRSATCTSLQHAWREQN